VGDLVDTARPGEEVEVTGIFVHSQMTGTKDKSGFPVFRTVIEANGVQKKSSSENSGLSDADVALVKELAQDPQIGERIIRAVAPSIYGHRHAKTALALALFGGQPKGGGAESTHRVRGDINVLLLGGAVSTLSLARDDLVLITERFGCQVTRALPNRRY